MIKEWFDTYQSKTNAQAEQALREIMQEIALAGLQRSGFFEKAAFYGGTALRIFHGLPRFSEDLDFSLLKPLDDFSLQAYLDGIVEQFEALGMQVSIAEKAKTKTNNIDSAFLKADTTWKELILKDITPQEKMSTMRPDIKIKLEVDTEPPPGFTTEDKLLIKPFSFYVKCFSLPDLFAGKMHALLFRKWKDRVKGRDWFDLEWYIQRNTPLHLEHLRLRAADSGDWNKKTMTKAELMSLLRGKINHVSFNSIRDDVVRFIPDKKVLDIWSPKYFTDLIQRIQFV
ncbi:MAG TPA: nucleotidyl transferase AbiEii/AbiGii toxin family protein [Chryseolinea sp.]|nr:nucleotidyl transferase AbiEii/AbiGii toxin family protein [Chryseolinea sp.]